jgi:hypothetical protein
MTKSLTVGLIILCALVNESDGSFSSNKLLHKMTQEIQIAY